MTGRTILVADDEQGLRDLFHFVLEPLGYEVVTAANGAEAIARVEERPFDLIILDVHMPEMGGPEAFARIRQIRQEQKMLVVSSSSDVDQTFEKQVTRIGDIECLYKPLTLDEITDAIGRSLGEAA